jgi:glycosyltransferase involved in cell wall biosynthesis
MPHISVTIPTYNRGHLIGRTIESVLQQEFDDYDLMVVDDASSDNTVKIVSELSRNDRRIRLAVNDCNLGLTRNWNRCLDLAQGPLVQVLLSDDLIDPDYLKIVSERFESYPETGFVAASCRYIDAQDNVIHAGNPISPCYVEAGDEAVSWFLSNGFPHVSSIVMRRQCYEELGKFDQRIWHGPDVEMDARLASKYNFYHYGSIHTSFRRHGSNMGNLEYLRSDFLEVDRLKRSKAWGYLSVQRLARYGIDDLQRFIDQTEVQVALSGAVVTLAYGRPEMSRRYIKKALILDPRAIRLPLFWKAVGINLLPRVGRAVLQRRMKISLQDQTQAWAVEKSLTSLRQTDD